MTSEGVRRDAGTRPRWRGEPRRLGTLALALLQSFAGCELLFSLGAVVSLSGTVQLKPALKGLGLGLGTFGYGQIAHLLLRGNRFGEPPRLRSVHASATNRDASG